MIVLIEILFLIFGIVFNKNGLLITTLVLSSFWLAVTFFGLSTGGTKTKRFTLVFLARIICFALSIIFLVI